MGYELTVGHFTDKGLVRAENQDSCFVYVGGSIAVFCVADGMGGHACGKRASAVITDGIREWTDTFYVGKYKNGFSDILEDFEKCLSGINSDIFAFYNQGQICGSTVVSLIIYEQNYGVFSVGDSRVYRRRGTVFEQITRDDNWQNSAAAKRIPEKELRHHRNYNKLIKAMGTDGVVVPSRITDKLKRGDMFLLCSDGVYRFCSDELMGRYCRKSLWGHDEPIETRLKRIKEQVMQKGARDNLTAVMVQVGKWKNRA